tara:strand:+ start:3415 stop:3774 length:360 start_codon:yes stop_codon:yes gene_type:complete
LKPKSYKEFYDDIAEEAVVHKDLVSDFISFFYSKVRKNLSDLKHPKIGLPGLGTFVIRTGKLKNKIKRHKDILGNLEKNTYKGYEKHVAVKEKLKQMEDLLKVVEKNIKIKKQFKNENK